VDVGVQEKILSPGVKDADHSDLGSEMLGVGGDGAGGGGAGRKQQIVERAWVGQSENVEYVGNCENDVKNN
jgi:hypothetical protein